MHSQLRLIYLGINLFLLSSSTSLCSVGGALNETTDRDALVAFKTTIVSDPYQILTRNWSADASVCNWIGVSCGIKHRRVTGLNFSSFGFEGTIVPNLGNLTFLISLDIRYNSFTGFIPHELSKLRRLRAIDVGFNSLTGQVPPSFGELRELQSIRLDNNSFFGSIPPSLGNSTKLRVIDFRANSLGGNIPQEIGNLSSLEKLYLGLNSQITGSIPSGIFNLSNIEVISLKCNGLSGSLPSDMCNHISPKLKALGLSLNSLSGQIPFDIYKCSKLQMLSLSSNHFSGSLPRSMGWLTELRTLYLGINSFQGGIPPDMCNLSRLELLSIPGASLIGQIPSCIFNMSSLQTADLSNNSLSGGLPAVAACHKLEELYLDSNKLNGQVFNIMCHCKRLSVMALSTNKLRGDIPKHVGNCTSLNYLYIDGNHLTGELPAEFGNLKLVEFSVHDNGFLGAIPISIFNISTLKMVDLSFNHFSGKLPSTMGLSLPELEFLSLSVNKLSGEIPSSLNNVSSLAILQLSFNYFVGSIPDLGNLRLLQVLIVEGTNLTGTPNQEMKFLSLLTSCRLLRMLSISLNQLDGILPASMGNFSSALEQFKAFGNRIRGSIPVGIGNLTGLQYLTFSDNELTGFIPTTLGKLKQLTRIYLDRNKLEGCIPNDLCQLTRLGDLYMSHNLLTGSIPACIGELKSLIELYLDSNKLGSTVPPSLWRHKDLLDVNLSTNMLSGSLPSEVGNLKVIESLDLSQNLFSGNIPNSIDGAESMVILSLAQNRFQGSIPQSMGNLRGLESLDLSFNNFSGYIPKSLERLAFLQHFNVSYNKLEGPIPTGGNFTNFTAQSYINNYGLCGATRLQVPLCRGSLKRARPNKVVSVVKYVLPICLAAIALVILAILLIKRRKSSTQPTNSVVSLLPTWRGSSYLELQHATNSFSEGNLLGSGSFGSVYIGTLSDGLAVAVKVFNFLQSEKVAKSFDTETKVLRAIRHRNLIKIIGCCSNLDFKALVYEYMPNGSLDKWLYSHNNFLDLLARLNVAIDVALALEYLHHGLTSPIVHCDLKPSNILLDTDMTAYVADFGIAKIFADGELVAQTKTLATLGYMAPEYGVQGLVSTFGDVYSFGIILLEMCTRINPTDEMFGEDMSLKNWIGLALQENEIVEVVDPNLLGREDRYFSIKVQCMSSILSLAMECLAISPSERIKMNEAVAKLKKIRTMFLANTNN